MVVQRRKVKIGILGCGAIGSRLALSVKHECRDRAIVSGIFDINPGKAQELARRLSNPKIIKKSFSDLLKASDLIVEAVNAADIKPLVRQTLAAKKDILAMSVGKLLEAKELFRLANKNGCRLLLPSGAVAGIDALKASGLGRISSITLTTRKPLHGFSNSPFIERNKINLKNIKSETVLFDGSVDEAVKLFPQNINVAATVALASDTEEKLRVRIITSPDFQRNSHEIELIGDFGRITTRTENMVCPDNPKTSYLAVLSAVQTLKQYFNEVKIGT